MVGEGKVLAGNSSCASFPVLMGWFLGMRQRKSQAEGQAHSRRCVTRDTGWDVRWRSRSAPAPLFRAHPGLGWILRLASSVRAGRQGLRAAGGQTDRHPGCTVARFLARAAAGLGSRPGRRGRGGRTRRDGMGCDERRAVHCGNPGAAATGSSSLRCGAGRRGRARCARAGSE